jgi:hypothetical protein
MIEFILIATAILSIRLKSESMLAVLFFSGFCLLYGLSEQYIENNYMYYVLACATDLFIIEFLAMIKKPTQVIMSIQIICEWFIYANLLGFIIYHFELQDIIYIILCGGLYIAALLSTLLQGGSGGIYRNSNVHRNIYIDYLAGKIALRKNKKATGN